MHSPCKGPPPRSETGTGGGDAAGRDGVAIGVGAGLLGFAAVVLLAGFFLAIGYGEDDERSSGRS